MTCPGAACHNLAKLPGVSGARPGTPPWHGCLLRPKVTDLVALYGKCPCHALALPGSSAAAGPLPWLRIPVWESAPGLVRYSIRATWVDRRAAELLGGCGSWGTRFPAKCP
ncbi:conserved protein of unknown function [Streptomyces sp. KY70]|nr:conserved protein of unknown function [Streptomyces sp. KY70]